MKWFRRNKNKQKSKEVLITGNNANIGLTPSYVEITEEEEPKVQLEIEATVEPVEEKKSFVCTICEKEFGTERGLKIHTTRSHTEK